ncbi:MAG: DUF4838 domain-containing protein [Clostridia bacterium]|nr:DUF4838 domain-containing protein [Clostridia bacterium]
MKRLIKLLVLSTLILSISLSVFACKKEDEATTYAEFTPFVYDGVHEFDIVETDTWLVKDGLSDYTILLPDVVDSYVKIAKEELQLLFKRATGISITAKYENELPEDLTETVATGKYISLADNRLYQAANLNVTEEDMDSLDYDGYLIRTKNQNVFLNAPYGTGVIQAVYNFLEIYFNFQYYYRNCWTIDKNVTDAKFLNLTVMDAPDIERRSYNVAWYGVGFDGMKTVDPLVEDITSQDVAYRKWRLNVGNGGHQEDLLPIVHDRKSLAAQNGYIHNAMEYLPRATDVDGKPIDYLKYYFEEYEPDAARVPQSWIDSYGDLEFNSTNMRDVAGWTIKNADNPNRSDDKHTHEDWYATTGDQICYTARGNADSFRALAKRCAEMIEYSLVAFPPEEYPFRNTVTITMEDLGALCGCEQCTIEREAENFTSSGSVIKLLNAVNKYVRDWMNKPENAAYKREDFHVVSFAYNTLCAPPAVYSEAEGKYVPCNDQVIADDGVGMYYADTRYFNYYTALYAPENQIGIDMFDAWDACIDYFWFWGYPTYAHATIFPHDSLAFFNGDLFQFFAYKDVQYVFLESQDYGDNATSFQSYACWMESQLMWDSSQDYDALTQRYFDAMYQDASDTMLNILKLYQTHVQTTYSEYGMRPNKSSAHDSWVKSTVYWPLQMVEGWVGLFDKAIEEISHYQVTNNNLYLVLKDRIDVESMTPLYIVLKLYGDGAEKGTSQLSLEKFRYYKNRLYEISVQYPLMSYNCSSEGLILNWLLTL